MDDLKAQIESLNNNKSWIDEVLLVESIWNESGRPALRNLAILTGRSKSWLDKSLQIAVGLRLFEKIKDKKSRHSAYLFVLEKKRKNPHMFLNAKG